MHVAHAFPYTVSILCCRSSAIRCSSRIRISTPRVYDGGKMCARPCRLSPGMNPDDSVRWGDVIRRAVGCLSPIPLRRAMRLLDQSENTMRYLERQAMFPWQGRV